MTDAGKRALKRRTILQAGAAMLGAGIAAGQFGAGAGTAALTNSSVKDIVYRRDGDRNASRAALSAGRNRTIPRSAASAWRRLEQQESHRRPEHLARPGRSRRRCAGDRFPQRARGALPGVGAGHQLRHPLAQSPGRRVRQQRRSGRRLRHVERRPPGAARRDPPGRSALPRAAARGRARHRCKACLRRFRLGRAVPARTLQARQGQGRC